MAGEDKTTTLTGAVKDGAQATEQVEKTEALRATMPPTERELAMDRIAAARNASFEKENGVKLGDAPATNEVSGAETGAAVNDTAAQIGKQLDDGTFVLDASYLDRVMVPTKVNGVEELVPATKALAQFQKGAAADVKLQTATAEATRMLADANAKLREANEALAAAKTPAEKKDAVAATESAKADLDAVNNEFLDALYDGDKEKAAKAFSTAMQLVAQGSKQTTETVHPQRSPTVEETVAAVKQTLSVDSALDKLLLDYPELRNDADLALIADTRVAALQAEGKPLAEAITAAGEYVGAKFRLGAFAQKDVKQDPAATAREQKLAAKEGLDEPNSTAARAATSTPAPQTPSQVIAEMAAQRSAGK